MSRARLPGERWNCEGCGEPLVGALTVNMKVAPVTVAVQSDGNVWLGLSRTPVVSVEGAWRSAVDGDGLHHVRVTACAVIAGALLEQLREKNVGLHLNHFANCPERARFARQETES